MSDQELDKEMLEDAVKMINSWINYKGNQQRTPGFNYAIVHGDETVHKESFGYSDLETQQQLEDHSFRIASLSKIFTSLTVMKLREQDRLTLDDHLSDHLDWLPEEMNDIRIKHILMHCGGLTRDGNTDYWRTGEFPTEQELREYTEERKPVEEPLKQWKYSNAGYGILGQLIQEVSGQSYRETVENLVLNPLGLENTEVDPEDRGNLATGYGRNMPQEERQEMEDATAKALSSATGLVSTIEDLANFASSTFSEDFIIDQLDLREMRKNHWDMQTGEKWGLGVKNMEVAGREVYGHSGSFPGHHTSIGVCPDEEIAVVVAGNTIDLEIEKWMKTILHTVLKTKDLYPEFEEELEEQDELEGLYTNKWGETEIRKLNNGLVMYYAGSKPLENYLKIVENDEGNLKMEGGAGYGATGERVHLKNDGETLVTGVSESERTEVPDLGESALEDWKQ